MPRWKDWGSALTAVGIVPPPDEIPWAERAGWFGAGQRFAGTSDGKRVELGVLQKKGVWVRIPIEPALDLGLDVRPEGVMVGPKIPSGNAEFDGLFAVTADEPARALGLLTPRVVQLLVALLTRSIDVRLGDDAIEIVGDGPQWLRSAAAHAIEIAHNVDDHRRGLPLAAPLQGLRPAFGRFAADHALRIDDNPLRLSGTARGVRVQASFPREAPGLIVMHASLRLDGSLGLDLRIERAGFLTPLVGLLPGQRDHRLGDDAFDAAFHVQTSRPELLAQALDGAKRAALLGCALGARSFVLDDAGVTAVVAIADHAPLPLEVLRSGVELVAGLGEAVRTGTRPAPQGPFR